MSIVIHGVTTKKITLKNIRKQMTMELNGKLEDIYLMLKRGSHEEIEKRDIRHLVNKQKNDRHKSYHMNNVIKYKLIKIFNLKADI